MMTGKKTSKYYDGSRLLSMKDANGKEPEIYICTSNRTAGKTTWFNRHVVKRFFKKGEKFVIVHRYAYELPGCTEAFFKDVGPLFFPGSVMDEKPREKGAFRELYLDGQPCGYALALTKAVQVKRLSHLFNDAACMLFDEFQAEDNRYAPREVEALISLHTSIARGKGELVRRVPVYLVSNPVSIVNPYYVEMGVTGRLKPDAHFLRGDGWVLEQSVSEAAREAQRESQFMKAFADNRYVGHSAESVYLNDNTAFVETLSGSSRYICTLQHEGRDYGVREFPDEGLVYCSDSADETWPIKISVTTEDHKPNYVMLRRNDIMISTLRWYFEHGVFRFKDLRAKDCVLQAITYR